MCPFLAVLYRHEKLPGVKRETSISNLTKLNGFLMTRDFKISSTELCVSGRNKTIKINAYET